MSLANFFRRPHYRSEATQFIDELKANQPQLTEQQLAGRALLWDRNVDWKAQREFDAARVRQQAYVYQTHG